MVLWIDKQKSDREGFRCSPQFQAVLEAVKKKDLTGYWKQQRSTADLMEAALFLYAKKFGIDPEHYPKAKPVVKAVKKTKKKGRK